MLLLAGCDDPSGVGVGVGGGLDGGEPRIVELSPTDLAVVSLGDSTTGVTTGVGARTGAERTLAGRVDDPLTGPILARGFLDADQPGNLSDDFTDTSIVRATLELVPSYVYGDTTQAVELAVRETITEIVTGAGAPLSNAPPREQPVSQPLTTVTFLPTDTLVTVDLPAVWLQRNEGLVRNDNGTVFNDNFHGFAFEYRQGNAVVGFDAEQSGVRFFGARDTVRYGGNKVYSAVMREGRPGNVPAGRVLVQDGVGRALDFSFDLAAADIDSGASVVRAEFIFFADTASVRTTGDPAFVRTQARTLQALGDTVLTEGAASTFETLPLGSPAPDPGTAILDEASRFRFVSPALRVIFQDELSGALTRYDRYRVRIPNLSEEGVNPALNLGEEGISPALLFTPETTQLDRRPRLLLTIVDIAD